MVRGRLVTPGRVYADGLVVLAGDRVVAVGPAEEAAADLAAAHPALPVPAELQGTVLPGLVDLHCHGGGGFAFTAGDESRSRVRPGTTSGGGRPRWWPWYTDEPERMLAAVAAAARARTGGSSPPYSSKGRSWPAATAAPRTRDSCAGPTSG